MNIILDSNVFKSNFLLSGSSFDILLDYLQRTNSKVIIPRIVYDEVLSLYRRQLEDSYLEYEKSLENLNKILLVREVKKDFKKEFFNQLVLDYDNYLRNKLKIKDSNFIEYKKGYLEEVVRRAINRIKPTKPDGKDFRDSLIWISILDYAKNLGKPIAFISDNVNDFADFDKVSLNKSLQAECLENKVEIKYSRNLREFVEKQSKEFDFVDNNWLTEQLDWFDFQNQMLEYLQDEKIEKQLIQILDKWRKNSVDRIEFLDIESFLGAEHNYVYEMLNGELMVSAVVFTVLSIDVNYLIELPMNESDRPIEFDYYNFFEEVGCNFNITLMAKNKSVVSIDVSSVDFFKI